MAHEYEKLTEAAAVVRIGQDLSMGKRETVNELRDLCKLLEEQGLRDIILDFAHVTVCPSVVFGNILVLAKRLGEKQGFVGLVNLCPLVAKSVQITGLTRSVRLFSSIAEASAMLKEGSVQ